ncbi:MAG TPA: SDR family oxidoreductase [Candidatus Binatia bacterium]|jgi:nucleoside-diphosphate-sugar epimerase|nr:SDR family oxidoreductase [Candidatus Binatia bacterium]
MKLLVTGCDGYIGSVLGPFLMARGHQVVGLDTGFYRDGCLYETRSPLQRTISRDIRQVTEEDLKSYDAVVHLAELSNDPLGQHSPDVTYEINHLGTVALARRCKEVGVQRFVYTSSCSVYGVASGGFKTETSETNPQTAYARCKVLVEKDLLAMADERFSPTFLRNATAYGPSPRIRFDIVLNNLAGLAWTTNEIKMTSDGTPYRPLVHIEDICRAIACSLEADRQIVHKQVFNVGANKENYQVRDIASMVGEVFPNCTVTFGTSNGDNRSYQVSFEKIHTRLPGFRCEKSLRDGTRELLDLFRAIDMTSEVFEFRAFTRLKQLQYLIDTGQINSHFFWSGKPQAAEAAAS